MANCSTDSPDISASGSRLLSLESPILASDTSSRTGPGGDDLSFSELELSDHMAMMQKPFSLLARLDPAMTTPTRNSKIEHQDISSLEEMHEENEPQNDIGSDDTRQQAARHKHEKLQNDIFVLKKLNASFETFNDTLQSTGSANERIAAQLEQTDALLNRYINILSKSEAFSRLLFDEQWQGAEADEDELTRQRLEANERIRREAEEQALHAQQEALRLEKEKQEELRREEKDRFEREKSERAFRGGIRGVRGTRASTRGMRGTVPSRTESTAGSSRGIPRKPISTTARPSNIGSLRGASRPI